MLPVRELDTVLAPSHYIDKEESNQPRSSGASENR